MRRVLVILAMTIAPALAGPKVEAIQAEFRKRNPGHWTQIGVDALGTVRHLQTEDTALVGHSPWTDIDVSILRNLLEINQDVIGGRLDHLEPLLIPAAMAFMLYDDHHAIVGEAVIHRTPRPAGAILDIDVRRAKLTEAAAARRLAGRRVMQTIELGYRPPLDCNMSEVPDCRSQVLKTKRREVTIDASEVFTTGSLRVDAGAIRLVICVTAEHPVPERDPFDMITVKLAGVPFVVDAVTGETLPMQPSSCTDPAIKSSPK